jgi:demethylmenaquinone methyltransferase/2-methoxy-6-polyprenyl-1,4-benzoquinol methylase
MSNAVRQTVGPAAPRPDEGADKAAAVQRMFGAVAPRYDLLNHLLSLNIDRRWRRLAVDRLLAAAPARSLFLDACAGTLDLAVELASRPGFQGRVIATDFALPMILHGVSKVRPLPVYPACGDALRQPLRDRSIDGAMVAFGIRNLASIDGGLREFARLLRPGAPLVILEFSTPAWQPFRFLYETYFHRILPRVGRLISRHDSAYDYLPASVAAFPTTAQLADRIRDAGFDRVQWRSLSGGIAALHSAFRAA